MTNLVSKTLTGDNGGFSGFNDRLIIPVGSINQILAGPGMATITIKTSTTMNGNIDGLALGHQDPALQVYNFDGDQSRAKFSGVNSINVVGAQTITSDPFPFTFKPGKGLVVSTHFSGATCTGRFVASVAGTNQFFSGADQVMVTQPTGVWGNDNTFTWTASIDFIPTAPSPGSDHASAELFPGGPAPSTQPALSTVFGPGPLPSPIYTPSTSGGPDTRKAALLQRPLQKNIVAMTQAVLAVPAGLTGLAANMLPVIPMRVLGMDSDQPDRGMWVIPLNLVGLKTQTVRAAYRDLRIEPGMRGMHIQYPTGGGPVQVTCNATGMIFTLVAGPFSGPLPLYMLEDGIDLTITAPNVFPPGTTCLLVQEKP